MKFHRTTLEQWRALEAVVEMGGFAQAAKALNRSQSAISYAVNTLQAHLGTPLLQTQGRRSVLTAQGQVLLRRATEVLAAMEDVEIFAQQLKRGLDSELWLDVDAYFPRDILMSALRRFAAENTQTKLQIRDRLSCRTSSHDVHPKPDLIVSTHVREAALGDAILSLTLDAVVSAAHPLAAHNAPLKRADLAAHTLITVCESGSLNAADRGWLNHRRRWVAASLDQAIGLVHEGMGYAWLPRHLIAQDVAAGKLRHLDLPIGQSRQVQMFLELAHPNASGTAAWRLRALLHEACKTWEQFTH